MRKLDREAKKSPLARIAGRLMFPKEDFRRDFFHAMNLASENIACVRVQNIIMKNVPSTLSVARNVYAAEAWRLLVLASRTRLVLSQSGHKLPEAKK